VSAAFVPLSFAPGEAYQFDWSHEVVLINGVTVTVKVAHVRLCHSRMLFVRAYPRETQEMVFDAHDRAFAFFKGTCTRGIYDNMKTAVETIFVGKERAYNRRFLQMCGHYLVDPVACTPASGWEKGQVENQVGLVRERFFTRGCGSRAMTSSTPGCSTGAWPMPRRTGIPSSATRRSGRRSRPSGQAWFPMPVASTASMR
jgi:transposase